MVNNYSVYEDGTVSFTEAQSIPPSLCPADGTAVIEFELNRLLQRDERAGTQGQSHRQLLPFHWQGVPELPIYASDIPSPALDIIIAHDERMQRDNAVGSFCGAPIITLDKFGMEVDEERELVNRLTASSGTSVPAEILPGEECCVDGIIRRITTTEAVGYDSYHNQEQTEAGQKRVSMAEARKAAAAGAVVYWRPNRATTEVYTVGTELPCLSSEPEPFALIKEAE